MKNQLALSIMCADQLHLGDALVDAERAGAEFIHADIMDGNFVDNITFGFDQIKHIAEASHVPVEAHIMAVNLDVALPEILATAVTHVCVHVEATTHPIKYLRQIRAAGKQVGIALNPHTPAQFVQHLSDYIDYVLAMTVEPGFAGQKFLSSTLPKIKEIRAIIGDGKNIVVDGNINIETALQCKAQGANVFVLGTSVAYPNQRLDAARVAQFRQALDHLAI